MVTGHDATGRSVILSDAATPHSRTVADGAVFHELYSSAGTPARLSAQEPEPTATAVRVPPPQDGTVIRFVDLPPGARSPVHRTESLDYGIVLRGEVWLVVEGDETALRTGDVVVQRGTSHAWENRSEEPATMIFVLIAGTFTPELRALLGDTIELINEPPAQ